jgi:hypothetical protein
MSSAYSQCFPVVRSPVVAGVCVRVYVFLVFVVFTKRSPAAQNSLWGLFPPLPYNCPLCNGSSGRRVARRAATTVGQVGQPVVRKACTCRGGSVALCSGISPRIAKPMGAPCSSPPDSSAAFIQRGHSAASRCVFRLGPRRPHRTNLGFVHGSIVLLCGECARRPVQQRDSP